MPRFRASQASSPLDQQVHSLLTKSERLVQEALGLCAKAKREARRSEAHNLIQISKMEKQLGRVLAAVSEVGLTSPRKNQIGDLDLDAEAHKKWQTQKSTPVPIPIVVEEEDADAS